MYYTSNRVNAVKLCAFTAPAPDALSFYRYAINISQCTSKRTTYSDSGGGGVQQTMENRLRSCLCKHACVLHTYVRMYYVLRVCVYVHAYYI